MSRLEHATFAFVVGPILGTSPFPLAFASAGLLVFQSDSRSLLVDVPVGREQAEVGGEWIDFPNSLDRDVWSDPGLAFERADFSQKQPLSLIHI